MAKDLARDHPGRSGGTPLKVAIGVAIFGVLGMLIVDHGPWNKPKMQPASMASSTGEAARAAGAEVIPTEPKLRVEPEPHVPKPVHPVNPAPQ